MGEEKDYPFNVDSFVESRDTRPLGEEEAIHFYDGTEIQYGRFYAYNYKRRKGRKKIAQNSQQDTRVRSED